MTRYGTAPSTAGHYDASPSDLFGAAPFSIHRRRKRGDALARWTTKAVLLSPLFILTVWSLVVMFSGTKKLSQVSNTSRGMKLSGRPHPRQSVKAHVKPHKKGATSQVVGEEVFIDTPQQQRAQTLVVQPPNMGTEQQQAPIVGNQQVAMRQSNQIGSIMDQDGKMVPVYAALGAEEPMMQTGQQQAIMTSVENPQRSASYSNGGEVQNLAVGSVLDHQGKILPVYVPYGGAQSQVSNAVALGNALTSTAAEGSMARVMNGNIMTSTAAEGSMARVMNGNIRTSTAAEGSMARVMNGNIRTSTSQASDSNPMMDAQQANSNVMMNSNPMTSAEQIPVVNPMGTTGDVVIKPRHEPKKASTKILYYDASSAYVDGKLYMPDIVYDEYGNEVNLSQLQAKTGADVYLEPPSTQASEPKAQATQGSPQRQMSRSDLERLASQPPAQDQYIIIATVAVMALLVGALSARRLRSRNFLSSCIENESLEDEIAYDVATTNGDYSTFAGNWKGADLEKFDV